MIRKKEKRRREEEDIGLAPALQLGEVTINTGGHLKRSTLALDILQQLRILGLEGGFCSLRESSNLVPIKQHC